MKKVFVIIICFATQLNALAQLKVHSNGYVSVNNDYSYATSPLSIGGTGSSGYQIYCNGQKNGAQILTMNRTDTSSDTYAGYFRAWADNGRNCTGIRAHAFRNSATGNTKSIGVMGIGSASSQLPGWSYGVFGGIGPVETGAGIYGSTTMVCNSFPDSRYAGYFSGPTKVAGDLSVTGSIQGTVLGCSSPLTASGGERDSYAMESVTGRLCGLSTMVFHHQRPESDSEAVQEAVSSDADLLEEFKEMGIEEAACEPTEDVIGPQILSKAHYALDAEQLEKTFPDLVYEQKDGTKSINYMEMIPLLVQSINELQAQIKEQQVVINSLTDNDYLKKAPAVTGLKLPAATSQAVLYQNTPNPFTERTEIRFSLPDGTASAAICIFDMSGKMLRQIPISSGMQSVTVAGYELSAGMYLYSLVVGGQEVDTKRMILSN